MNCLLCFRGKPLPRRRIRAVSRWAAVGVLGVTAGSAFAGNTWTGGGTSNNWSDSGNWGGSQPGYGTLTFSGSTRTTNTDDNITAMNQLLWTGSSNWTLNQGGSTVLSLFDNSGAQAKVENQSTGLVTINLPVTFAANNGSPPNPFGEINAVNGDITFASGTLTVNGSSVNGVRLFGGTARTATFNNTVSADGKWFDMLGPLVSGKGTGTNMTIGGSFTAADVFVTSGSTLNLGGGGSLTGNVRLGGDVFADTSGPNSGFADTTKGATFNLTAATGGQAFSGVINSMVNNTSNALVVNSQNTSGTNTITGGVFLDSALKIQNSAGGSLTFSTGTIDIKAQTITFSPAGTITVTQSLGSSSGAGGSLVKSGSGTLILQNTSNNYTGTNSNTLNASGTQIGGGVLGIYADTSLGVAPAGAYNNIQFTASGTLQDTANDISLHANRNISVASGATATFDSNGNKLTVNGVVNGSGAVAKTGSGTVALTGANTYSGGTTVSAGVLQANSSDATNGSTGSGAVAVNGGTLAGTGIVKGSVSVNSGGTVSGGDGGVTPGKLTTGGQTWAGGGMYLVNMSSATGAAGTSAGYSQLSMSSLSVTASAGNTFTVNLSGSPTDFDPHSTYTWTVAVVSGGAPGTGTTGLILNTSNFHPTNTPTGNFSLSFDPGGGSSSNLDVTYSESAPEPAAFAFALTAALPLLIGRPRRTTADCQLR